MTRAMLRWGLLAMLAACGEDKKGEGEPCSSNDECGSNLICDDHPGGSGACEYAHDHEPDCEAMPQACTLTDGQTTSGSSGSDSSDTGSSGSG